MIECFCILAGGGVRGTAYVGAIKALEELDVKITGLAGSSVGAFIASLLAIGYTHGEIKEFLYDVNYQKFRDLYIPFGKDFGFFKGDEVYYWIKDKIEKKFYGKNRGKNLPPVTFRNLDKELIIIVTDVSYNEFKEYNRVKTPDVEIAHAVRASISLPGFFKPVWENDRCLVDGEFVNNYPLWKIESDIISNTNSKILELRLESTEKPREINNVFDYFNAIIDTNYSIATETLYREFGENDQFEIIRIDIGKVKIVDFGISNVEKEKMITDGHKSIKKYFNYDLIDKRKKLEQIYKKINGNLMELRNNINRRKIPESFMIMGALSIYIAENKGFIHKYIYQELINLQNIIQNRLFSVNFLNINFLRDKKEVILIIDRILDDLDRF